MKPEVVFDIETDGFLDTVSKIHCLNAIDRRTGREYRFTDHEYYQDLAGAYTSVRTPRDGTIADGIAFLMEAGVLVGHNIIEYDIPALEKVRRVRFPRFRELPRRDTNVMSKLIFSTLKDTDFAALRKGRLPMSFQLEGLIGKHSLRAWGIRLGKNLKGDFNPADYGHTWATMPFIQEMDEYCMQDVRVNVDLLNFFEGKEYSEDAIMTECRVAEIIARQVRHGVMFDVAGAERLVQALQKRKLELEDQLRTTFAPWFKRDGKSEVVPKKTRRMWVEHEAGAQARKVKGETQAGWYAEYIEGAPFTKIKLVDFNPASRDHIADRMMRLYEWVPEEFTANGRPKVDEETLASLPYGPAKLCVEYLTVDKRLGQIAEGNEAWLKSVGPDGRIHGQVNTLGAVTTRMTHYNPNLGQVPRVTSPYGAECRALFIVPPGKKLVGCDADGLEARMQGHYLARYDDGAFVRMILEGRKEDGTDLHSRNQRSTGFNSRDNAKTLWYAQCYGAGNYKLGTIVVEDFTPEKRDRFNAKYQGKARNTAIAKLGKRAKERLVAGIAGLTELSNAVAKAAKRGYLVSLDGAKLHVRSAHAALNTLFQGGGARVMKLAQVILDDALQDAGLVPGEDYEFCLTVHDEFQLEVREEHAEFVGRTAAESIRLAGERLRLRCPLAGNYQVGDNWRDTH